MQPYYKIRMKIILKIKPLNYFYFCSMHMNPAFDTITLISENLIYNYKKCKMHIKYLFAI